jgi:TfoX/Sxy family transcriptional regulator of competence genes
VAWRKSPPDLIAAFDAALPDDRRVQRRSMFGYPCAFARGNMFTGLHQESLIVRLPEAERARLLRDPGAAVFEPMPGRQMKEYVAVPPEVVEDAEVLRGWMATALDYAASLPAKGPKGAKRAAAGRGDAGPRAGQGGGRAPAGKGSGRAPAGKGGKVPPRGVQAKVKAAAGARSARGARGR